MKPTHIPPKLLLPGADPVTISECFELTEEEIALRHRLELRVERALYRTAVVLQAVYDGQNASSARYYLDRGWQNEQKVQRAWSEVESILQELRDRQLYRSTHQNFDRYCRERFGSFVQDQSPVIALES